MRLSKYLILTFFILMSTSLTNVPSSIEFEVVLKPKIIVTPDNLTRTLNFRFNSSYTGRASVEVKISFLILADFAYLSMKIELNNASTIEFLTSSTVKTNIECSIMAENYLSLKLSGFLSGNLIIREIHLKIKLIEQSFVNWIIPIAVFLAPFVLGFLKTKKRKDDIIILMK